MAAKRSVSSNASRRRLVSSSALASVVNAGHDDDDDGEVEADGSVVDNAPVRPWPQEPRRPTAGPRRSLNGRIASMNPSHRSVSRMDAGSSSEASGSSAPGSRVASSSYANRSGMSTLARANARRISLAPSGGLTGTGPSVPAAQKLTVDSTSFEEWMKMATDNKINSTNTFSIALIDYFHDMSLLRSDSGDGSINFQKASCTLDGCVKVWTSRVDSVVNETGKLLNGLVGDGKGSEDVDDLEGEVELDEDGNPVAGKGKKDKRKRPRAKEATLVKNFSAIAVKKLDLEYTVDPLFKKTSADFDEGGAGGLLMNHLGVDDKMRVVFDAGEAPGLPESSEDQDHSGADSRQFNDEEDGDAAEDSREASPTAADGVAEDRIDLSRLSSKLFSLAPPSLLQSSDDPVATLLNGRLICPSLARFSFAPDQEGALFGGEDEDEEQDIRETTPFDLGPMNPAVTATPWAGHDQDYDMGGAGDDYDDVSGADLFGVPAEYDDDGDVFGMPAEPATGSTVMSQTLLGTQFGGNDDGPEFFDDFNGPEATEDAPVHWDPRQGPSQHDLLLAFKGVAGNDDEGRDADASTQNVGGGLFDYFDQRLMKNWAGPEHWKMRNRLAGFGARTASGQLKMDGEAEAPAQVKKKRAPKEAFVIDFIESEAPTTKELFEAPKTASSILLPKTRSRPEAHLLPEDRHFTSRRLLRLFSKPRAVLNIRTKKGATRFGGAPGLAGFGSMPTAEGEIDASFWAKQQAVRDGEDGADFGGADGMDTDEGAPMPLDTQFYHDGDEDGAFEMAAGMAQVDPNSAADVDVADFEEEDLASQAAALKRVKPEYVNYAKKAKRVDVRKLKENIWRELGIEGIIPQEESQESDAASQSPSRMVNQPSPVDEEAKTFQTVLSGLRKSYTKDKMEEISTSFCFICLLHLANEEGLELKVGDGGKLLSKMDSNVLRRVNGALAMPSRIVEEDEDDDDDDDDSDPEVERGSYDDEEEDEFGRAIKVGRLEYLKIKKDPNAGRSA